MIPLKYENFLDEYLWDLYFEYLRHIIRMDFRKVVYKNLVKKMHHNGQVHMIGKI
jgi:hypothetical protein